MELHNKASFDFVRYATCWEDANILRQGLDIKPEDKVISIGSGGDNSFALLIDNPSLVVVADISKVQLYLIELKIVAIKHLTYDEVISFFGYSPCANRNDIYNSIKQHLSDDVLSYWNHNLSQIEKGIIYQGKFEKYLGFFAKNVIPFIHSKKTIAGLLALKSAAAQAEYYDRKWNTFLWRSFFKIFFSKWVMGKFGRDPEFLKQVDVNVSEYILLKTEKHLKSTNAQKNLFLHYCLTGTFGNFLPDYLESKNFDIVKKNLFKLKLHYGYLETAFQVYGKFDKMNLSNIFEYMDNNTFEKTQLSIVENTKPEGKIAYWNLMVTRETANVSPNLVTNLTTESQNLSTNDRGFFYKQFLIDKKLKLCPIQ